MSSMEQQPPFSGGDARRPPQRSITPLSVPAIIAQDSLDFPLSEKELSAVVKQALQEDGAFNDVTTIATVVSGRRARGRLVARDAGIICGVPFALQAFRLLDPKVTIRVNVEDGGRAQKGTTVLSLTGHARGLLSAERVALNFMQRLSGVATHTARFVAAVEGTGVRILDTRKTTPGWRKLEKYAVRAGGGMNHRMDLSSAVLIKDNHLAAVNGDVGLAVRRARELASPGTKVEVECDSLEQVKEALEVGAEIILLDNMPPELMRQCAEVVAGRAILEASGGVRLDTVRGIAESGVNWISSGSLTHSAPALNLALDFD